MKRINAVIVFLSALYCLSGVATADVVLGPGSGTADDQTAGEVPFTPAGSIAATDVQDAIEELDTEKSDDQTAAEVTFTPAGNIAATDVQDAIEELDTEKTGPQSAAEIDFAPDGTLQSTNVQEALEELEEEKTDDQTAAEVTFTPAGNIAATDVQNALEELDTEKTDDQTAAEVTFTAAGNIAATDVQNALEELDDEKGVLTALEAADLNDTSDPHLLTAAELAFKTLSNADSTGADEWDFPARANGWNFTFMIEVAQNVALDPNGTEAWYLNGTQGPAGQAIVNEAPTVGESLSCISTQAAVYCKSSDPDWEFD